MLGALDGFQIPEHDKIQINDAIGITIIKTLGDHQIFVNFAFCTSLSSYFLTRTLPMTCSSLIHLDISYTQCDDLTTIFQQCTCLRTLNAAGLQLLVPNIKGIEAVYTLEALHDLDVSLEFFKHDFEGLSNEALTHILVDARLCLL
jgi:hypothetical protein